VTLALGVLLLLIPTTLVLDDAESLGGNFVKV
jgi:hypothetical protein